MTARYIYATASYTRNQRPLHKFTEKASHEFSCKLPCTHICSQIYIQTDTRLHTRCKSAQVYTQVRTTLHKPRFTQATFTQANAKKISINPCLLYSSSPQTKPPSVDNKTVANCKYKALPNETLPKTKPKADESIPHLTIKSTRAASIIRFGDSPVA